MGRLRKGIPGDPNCHNALDNARLAVRALDIQFPLKRLGDSRGECLDERYFVNGVVDGSDMTASTAPSTAAVVVFLVFKYENFLNFLSELVVPFASLTSGGGVMGEH